MGGEPSDPRIDVAAQLTAELGDSLVVLGLRLGGERRDVRLVESGEDRADTLFVRPPGDAPDVVLGDGSEWDAVAREHAIPGDCAAHAVSQSVPSRSNRTASIIVFPA